MLLEMVTSLLRMAYIVPKKIDERALTRTFGHWHIFVFTPRGNNLQNKCRITYSWYTMKKKERREREKERARFL